MRFIGRESRFRTAVACALLGLIAVVAMTPLRLVAAEPKQAEKRASQHTATIRIHENGNVLIAPRITFIAGQKPEVRIGDQARSIEISIASDPKTNPIKHSVLMKLIENGNTRTVLTADRMTITDGESGSSSIIEASGNGILMHVQIQAAAGLEPATKGL